MSPRLTVLGAGTMGTGIAALALTRGAAVTLVDDDPAVLAGAAARVDRQVRHATLVGAAPEGATGELRTAGSLSVAAESEVVIETVPEDAGLKGKVLREVSALVAPATPIMSTTSGIPIAELAEYVERPAELLGAHFMNPTYLIAMVEVARGPSTSDATVEAVRALLTGWGRRAVVVHDSPGFVTSRLLHPMINEAARLVGEGVATPEQVDTLMTGCLGHPTGPLRTADLIGLDNLADALTALSARTGDERQLPCAPLLDRVAAGRLGRKSGAGFYDYEGSTH